MIAANNIFRRIFDKRWNSYVVPCFGIFRYQHISDLYPKTVDFVDNGGSSHKRYVFCNSVVLVNIDVVAQSNWNFVLFDVFIHVAYLHIYDRLQASHLPMRGNIT